MVIRSSIPHFFFSKKEKRKIQDAIFEAERKTSGEIRVHLQKNVQADLWIDAQQTFERLGMTATQDRNGVLIFFCTRKHQFVVLADVGIHQKAPPDFWDEIVHRMENYFKQDRFAEGLIEGIHQIGEKLQTFFPVENRNPNELPNWISYAKFSPG